jgi:hypothetical protein
MLYNVDVEGSGGAKVQEATQVWKILHKWRISFVEPISPNIFRLMNSNKIDERDIQFSYKI